MLGKIVIQRLLYALPLLLGVSFISFVLIESAPGNYFQKMRLNPQISERVISQYEAKYHLNEPIVKQYLWWLLNLLKGDLGYSFYYHMPVKKVIGSRIKNTLILSLISLVIIWIIVLPMGVTAVKNRFFDGTFSVIAFIFMCIPSFFLAFIFLFLAMKTGLLPLGGMHSLLYDYMSWPERLLDLVKHMIIPTSVIALSSVGSLFRLVKANLYQVMHAPYIINAYAKGLPEDYIIWNQALPNALHPLVVIFGYQLSDILSGAALTEIICDWPGMGTMMLTAVQSQDLYLVMAGMMLSAFMLIFGNIISDILLYWLDPTVREAVR